MISCAHSNTGNPKGLLQMECDAEGHVCELELIQIPQTQAQIPITAAKRPSAPVVSVKPATPKAVAASVSARRRTQMPQRRKSS